MALKLYDTFTRKLKIFKPLVRGKVQLFVCGITPYDYAHIGHAKSYVQFDLLARWLRAKGFDVFYLQNVTDINDTIIDRAKERKKEPLKLAHSFEKEYFKDMDALGVKSIDKYVRATDYIPEIISQIKRLIDKGLAYEIDDGVYYDMGKFKWFGQLSKQPLDQLTEHRIAPNPQKHNQGDFALWKKQKPGEPAWDCVLEIDVSDERYNQLVEEAIKNNDEEFLKLNNINKTKWEK